MVPDWLRATVRLRRVPPPVGHMVRGGLCVGVPAVVGFAADDVVLGVTIGLACVLRTIGEHEGTHRANAKGVLIATPIAACGYLFGAVQGLPLPALIALMAAVAFAAGTLSIHGPAFALAGMQLLLVTSVALGVPDTGVVRSLGLFFLGAAIYAACMAVDFLLVEPHRPERVALADLDRSIQAFEAAQGAEDRAVARSAAHVALAAARQIPTAGWRTTAPGIERWGSYDEVVEAADHLVAFDAAASGAEDRRGAYDRARASLGTTRPRPPEPAAAPADAGPSWRARLAVDAPARAQAGRLALCFAIAVSSRGWIGLDHWFWVPAAVGLVMQPDFGSVFGRAVLRVAGTIAGSLIAAAVVAVLPGGGVPLGIAIGLLAATIPWAKATSYALMSVSVAAVILLLVDQLVPAEGSLGLPVQRILATAAGGAIVLVFGYLIWPSARRVSVARSVAPATAQIARLLRSTSEPVPADAAGRAERRRTSSAARQQAFDLLAATRVPLGRAAGEPPPASTDAATWSAAVAAVEQLAVAVADHAIARLDGALRLDGADALADQIGALAAIDDPAALTVAAQDLQAAVTRS